MKFLITTLHLTLLLLVKTYAQSTPPATYTALHAQLENQSDSIQFEHLSDFVQDKVGQGNFVEATTASQDMLAIAKRTGDQRLLARAYISGGYIAQSESNSTQAVVLFQRAVAIYRQTGDWYRQAATLDRISWVYIEVRNLSLAEAYCMQGLAIAQKHDLKKEIVNLYGNLATIYDIRKQYKKALQFNDQCIKIAQSIGADYSGALLNKGIMLKNAGQYEASVTAYQQALQWAETHQDTYMKEMVYINLPNTLLLLNRPDEAEHYVQLGLKSVKQHPNQQHVLQEIYGTLTTIYEKKGQYRQALDYHRQWVVHRDSIFNTEKSHQLVEAETRFQTREKQQQIQRLDDDNLRQKQQVQALIGGVSLLALLLGIMAWQYRALRRANALVNQTLKDLKRTQNQLIQKEKMASLGELTAGIAHEIQNPLNFVNNFAEVSVELADELHQSVADNDLALTQSLSQDLRQNMQQIAQNGQRASNIVRAMLEHSSTSTGERQAIQLNTLAEEYLRLAYHGFRAKDSLFTATLNTDFQADLPPLEGVVQDLSRVLLNLYNNAFYALRQRLLQETQNQQVPTSYEPTLWVRTRLVAGPSGRQLVELRVKDNGLGIAAGIQAKVFQPFFTTKPTGQGTGLGLSLSYDIITKGHGGELYLDSQVGRGTEFIIRLPLH